MRLDAFIEKPKRTARILNRLVDDPELYVRRSVANHLNDISKDHPEIALEMAGRWWNKKGSLSKREQRRSAVKHGLRDAGEAGS